MSSLTPIRDLKLKRKDFTMGEAMRREDLAMQLAIDGSETPLARVRSDDDFKSRVEGAVMGGDDFETATARVSQEMAEERLAQAFGKGVVRVDPDSFGNPA